MIRMRRPMTMACVGSAPSRTLIPLLSLALLVHPVAIVDALVYRSHENLQTATTVRCEDIQTWDAYELALGFVYEVPVHLLERDACIANSCVEIQVLDKPDD